jgi:hypothetical protein
VGSVPRLFLAHRAKPRGVSFLLVVDSEAYTNHIWRVDGVPGHLLVIIRL